MPVGHDVLAKLDLRPRRLTADPPPPPEHLRTARVHGVVALIAAKA